ncbi:DUF4333 domain-containing protein [Amycolatopsis acidiphila]|uniref:DUF4333 domain-containing protein n=1 Tax=Amycolatopsis acidiphila TaxID=715473 RepID=UPI0019ADDAC5|nr:DUF4333 domain-containing protein [Amycolatopsis acidiphila]UIJ62894.1 DUF4333 domain-containing protein [Amycolatopsis acidiphila]GHG64881.1 hypothetical protein GCM10017788_21960 [Amycolatopsis acidiphila]
MSRRARTWAGLAGAGVLLLAGCDGSGGGPPSPGSLGRTSGGGASSASSTRAPASRVFDAAALENGVRQVLTESYGIADVTGVRCPSGQTVQVGISFDCEVTVAGQPRTVTLMVQTPDGTYQVSAPK